MNATKPNRTLSGHARVWPPRLRLARPDLATRLSRARLVYLLGRSGQPLTDWVPLGLAAAVIGLMFVGGAVPGIA